MTKQDSRIRRISSRHCVVIINEENLEKGYHFYREHRPF